MARLLTVLLLEFLVGGIREEFWSLVGEMKRKGFDMDIDTYRKLSRHFKKSKMMKDAVGLYEFMMDWPYNPATHD